MRVADQVLEHLRELHRVGGQRRQRVAGDARGRLVDRRLEVGNRARQRLLQLHRLEILVSGADPRVGEQVLDQLLHARRAVHDVAHELARVGSELVAVAPAEKLRVARYHAQRLLQVVRGDVRELLQLRVAALELLVRLAQRRLGVLAFGDVVEHRDRVKRPALGVALHRDRDVHPDQPAVLAEVALVEARRLDLAGEEACARPVGEVAVLGMRKCPSPSGCAAPLRCSRRSRTCAGSRAGSARRGSRARARSRRARRCGGSAPRSGAARPRPGGAR